MKIELLASGAGGAVAWRDLLAATPHDFYHLPSYVTLSGGVENAEPCALYVAEGGRAMLLPILLRDVPGAGARDAVTPYGYPGPLFRGGYDANFAREASEAMASFLRAEGVVSLFVRLHPILNR